MIIVERATEDDYADICAIDAAVTGDYSRAAMLAQAIRERHCISARRGNQRLGFLLVDLSFFTHYFIINIIVHPKHRRQGVARALLGYIEKICPKDRIFTAARESDGLTHTICSALGFIRSGQIDNIDNDDPYIIYVKFWES